MATATIEKKKCRDIKACKGSPAFKGCGKNFVITKKNFEVNKNSKDGFNHTCLKCKAKFEEYKKELNNKALLKEQADAKAKEKKKILKAEEKAKIIEDAKEAEAKATQEALETERIAQEEEEEEEFAKAKADAERATHEAEETKLAEEKEQTERDILAEEAKEARLAEEAKEQAEREVLAEALKRPEVTFDQVKQARLFGKKSEDTILTLTGLAKLEENVIIFLHSIMLFADPDDELYATKDDVQKDMCERFRVEGLATLKPFTWKAAREDWIVCRKEPKGYDKVKDVPIQITTHFNITAAGIEWYNLWLEEQGLPKPIVPKKLRIPKAKEVQTIDGHSGSSSPGQENTAFELALNKGQNSANAKDMYINFLIDYKKEHKCTHASLGEKIGVSGPLISLACGKKRSLSPAHYPAIAALMNINKTPALKFTDEEDTVVRSTNQKQIVSPSQYMLNTSGIQSEIFVNAIAQATRQHDEALMNVKEAELKVRIYANKIQFLESEFHQIV